MNYLIYTDIAIGLLLIVLGIPLLLGKIKPNNIYGFRTKKTISDEKIWYPANKYSGKLMVFAGIIIIILSIIFYIIYPYLNITQMQFLLINLAVLFIPIFIMLMLSFAYLKKL